MLLLTLLGIFSLIFSLISTRLVRNASLRLGVVDKPDNQRKLHLKAIPRVGGVAVFLSYGLALFVIQLVPLPEADFALLGHPRALWLLASLAVVFATGLIDDLAGLRPKQKLVGEVVAAVLVWAGGVQVHVFQNQSLNGWASLPLTVLWLLLCSNAFNLIDGLDGLAAGTSLVATLAMLCAAILDHNVFLLVMTVPLAGALLGFLRFNFNPATIFLGDCGSLSIGFLLGCFGVLWSEKLHTFLGIFAPVMALSLPLMDTFLSIVRRYLRRRPIFSADRGHIHHRLLDRGKSPREVALLLYAGAGVAAAFALLDVFLLREFTWVIIGGFCLLALCAVRYLGYAEFRVARRLLTRGVVFSLIDDQMRLHGLESDLRKVQSSGEAFEVVQQTCSDLGFGQVTIVDVRRDDAPGPASQFGACQVSIALTPGYFLVLEGLPAGERPLALRQLEAILADSFREAAWLDERCPLVLPRAVMDTVSQRSRMR